MRSAREAKSLDFLINVPGDEGALPDEDHLCTEEYEGTASKPGKTSFSRDGTA